MLAASLQPKELINLIILNCSKTKITEIPIAPKGAMLAASLQPKELLNLALFVNLDTNINNIYNSTDIRVFKYDENKLKGIITMMVDNCTYQETEFIHNMLKSPLLIDEYT